MPTAIFHAVGDKICPFEFAEEMAKGIRTAKIIRFENSGHGLFLEEKEKFNSELIGFAGEGLYVPASATGIDTGGRHGRVSDAPLMQMCGQTSNASLNAHLH